MMNIINLLILAEIPSSNSISRAKCAAQILNLMCFYRLDSRLKEPVCSDEVVEVCGASGSGKTYLCLKMASLALVQKEIAVIYIDTTNYVNHENMSLVLSVSNLAPASMSLTLLSYNLIFLSLFCRISSKRLIAMGKPSKCSKRCQDCA